MTIENVQSYLFFGGRCAEALEFYRDVLGAQVEGILRFKDHPDACGPDGVAPDWEDKVMHSSFLVGGVQLMASDGMGPEETGFNGFSLCLTAPDEAAARALFDALADGGRVEMPLGKTFFSPCFGAVADRFGLSWMVIVPEEQDKT